jgi:hypothetical protein
LDKRFKYIDVMLACPKEIINKPLPNEDYYHYNEEIPVFFGHYWLTRKPKLENSKAICLDYSVAREGLLVAFRSDFLGTPDLEKGFVY